MFAYVDSLELQIANAIWSSRLSTLYSAQGLRYMTVQNARQKIKLNETYRCKRLSLCKVPQLGFHITTVLHSSVHRMEIKQNYSVLKKFITEI